VLREIFVREVRSMFDFEFHNYVLLSSLLAEHFGKPSRGLINRLNPW
jgi:hypothetical protein